MLTSIQIKNFALIESMELEFHQGMTVITGETGAGKSIVIDALGLALGERADTSVVRFGTDKADVTACFYVTAESAAQRWLKAQELDEGNECILRRIVAKEGRSKCFINGRAVTLNMLRELGDLLVDIHGQHAHQSLLKPHYQLQLLDELLEDPAPRQELHTTARAYKQVSRQLDELLADSAQRQERAELLAYQLNELEALGLSDESIENLENDHARASSLQELTEATERALAELFEEESAAYHQLAHYQRLFHSLAQKDPTLAGVSELLSAATANLEEVKSELRHYSGSLDMDPEQMQELDQRRRSSCG
jgi:DNA repair protein RecN (Recombination protein N)